MFKEKPQPNNQDVQSLGMARESLSRVKEMDLTPEEKEKVMAMIREAKSYEKNKELPKALKVYQELLKFLKPREIEAQENKNIVKYGDFEIKGKQAEVLYRYEEYVADLFKAIGEEIDDEKVRELILKNIEVRDGNIVKFKLSLNNPKDVAQNIKLVVFFSKSSARFHFLKLPDLSDLNQLEELDLSNNFWDYESLDFSNLKKIKVLNLSDTRFKDTPDISSLQNLEEFICQETAVPDLTKLTNLKKLDISECVADKFPDLSGLSTLESLRCDGNRGFPPDFTGLDNLRFISCSQCHLVKLPDVSHLKKLETLLCDQNVMIENPDLSQLVNLRELNLSTNLLDELPDLSANKKLKLLVCFGNNLSWLQIKKASLKLPKGCEVISKEKS